MSTTTYLWERERSAHLLAHSRPGTSRRRRAEVLARKARRGQRAGTGVAGSALHDEVTPSLWRRLTSKDDDTESLARGLFVGLGACAGLVLVGPAVLLGWGVYKALEHFAAPRVGRLPAWPGVAITAVLLVLIPLGVLPVGAQVHLLPHLPIVQVVYSKLDWLVWQIVLFPAVTAYLIWAWGWAGVPKNAVSKPEKNADGSFRVTPDEEKVALSIAEKDAQVEAVDAEQKPQVKRVVRRVRLAQPQEQEPVDMGELDPDELPPPPDLPDDDFNDYDHYDDERDYL
ncbi:hypothetical protein [Gordonia sp. VNK21]|uniref:hypothetical protein n=1 Tax=Gordonia sp. VNK21 TaxID=3382483 RepID=UPI0038D4CDA2